MFITQTTIAEPVTTAYQDVMTWIEEHLSVFINALVIFIIALIAVRVIRKLFSSLLGRAMRVEMFPTKSDRDKRLKTLTSISNAVVTFIVWSIALIMILNALGVNTAPILASAGILSVALGFGAQSLVKDFMTGMFIIAENQYRVGDYVEIGNVKGTVKAVTMRTTVVTDDDGSVFYIPNGSIVVTGNHTMNNSKVSLELKASTETDVDALRKAIDRTGKKQSSATDMLDLIIEPLHFARIKEIVGGTVVVRVTGKVKAGKQVQVKSDYYVRLQEELSKVKIALK